MGNPNEPVDPDRQPTETFAHPSDGPGPVPPVPPTQQFEAPGAPGSGPTPPQAGKPGGARAWMTGTRRTIVLTGVAGLLVGGVAGGLIGWASTGDSSSAATTNTAQSAPMARHHTQGQGQGQGQTKRQRRDGAIGTITALNGQSWTVAARNGRTVTVQIGADTKFGTAKKPQQQSDFAVGDRIVVVGKDNSGTVEATRVAKRAAPAAGAATPGATTPGASTQPS